MLTNFQFCAYPIAALSSLPPKSGQGRLASKHQVAVSDPLDKGDFCTVIGKTQQFFLVECALLVCNLRNSLILYYTSHNTHNAKSGDIEVNLG
jgi:hypothetical protein